MRAFILILLIFLLPSFASAQVLLCPGANYLSTNCANTQFFYVSPSGNDSNPGTLAQPWQTMAGVTNHTFSGTQDNIIRFQANNTFNTGCVTLIGNSNAIGPGAFYIGSYGGGQATLQANASCDGAINTEHSVINLNGVGNITVEGLNIVGDSGGTPYGIIIQNGLGSASPPAYNITVKNNNITGFNVEILLYGLAFDGACPPVALQHVRILNNSLGGTIPTSPDVAGIYGHGCQNNPTWPATAQSVFNMYDIVVSGNNVPNTGGVASDTAGSITFNGWNYAVAEHNFVHVVGRNVTSCGGVSGFEAFSSANVLFRYNEVDDVNPSSYTGGCDWVGIDCDGGVINCTIEKNYVRNTFGGCYLLFIAGENGSGWGPATVRDNICENGQYCISWNGFNQGSLSAILYGYNNSCWIGTNIGTDSGTVSPLFIGGMNPTGGIIANNIFTTINSPAHSVAYMILLSVSAGTSTFPVWLNNDWYAIDGSSSLMWQWFHNSTSFSAWETDSGETGGITNNPAFPSGGNGGLCPWPISSSYIPPQGPQPCPTAYNNVGAALKGAGTTPTSPPFPAGDGKDYYRNSITSQNIGAYGGN